MITSARLAAASGISIISPAGLGGRSSVSGIQATVFGATGFLGRYVVNRLAQFGGQVQIPYRGDEHDVRHLRVTGDLGRVLFNEYGILDQASVARSVKHSNVVINLAGQSYTSRHFTQDDVNVEGARNIARAAKAAGVARLVHVSALGAHPASPCAFLRSKAAGEQVVLEEFPGAVIVRLAPVFGPEDRFLNRLALLHRVPFIIPLPNEGAAIKQPVYCVDAAQGIVNTITARHGPDAVYEFAGPQAYTVKQLVEYTNELIRKTKPLLPLPELALPLLTFGAKVAGVARIKRLVSIADIYRFALDDEVSDASFGLADVGVTPTRLEQKALATLRRYRTYVTHDDVLELDSAKK